MTTRQFIAKAYEDINAGKLARGKCSSVFADGTAIYSYGYHYPLLFTIESETGARLWVRNTRGYSSTTARHICWAGGLADIDAIVPRTVGYGNGHYDIASTRAIVAQALREELEKIETEQASKARKNTQVYARLQERADAIRDALELLAK